MDGVLHLAGGWSNSGDSDLVTIMMMMMMKIIVLMVVVAKLITKLW